MYGSRAEDRWLAFLLVLPCAAACGGSQEPPEATPEPSTVAQLTDRLSEARITSAGVPAAALEERVWSFAEPRPEWRVVSTEKAPWMAQVRTTQLAEGLRLELGSPGSSFVVGGLSLELEGGAFDDWSSLHVRARTHERLSGIAVAYNLDEEDALPGPFDFIMAHEGSAPVFNDGSVQTYALPLVPRAEGEELRSLGIFAGAPRPASVEILSVSLVPRGADFPEDHGVRAVTRDSVTRRTLFAHAPATLSWSIRVPEGGRLDLGLSCLPGDELEYRVKAEGETVLTENVSDGEAWQQRSVDLARFAGRTVELALEASSERAGTVALWGAPVLSGGGRSQRPNVIFYVIDGGGADLMSLYGYDRETTPFLERLAAEAVVFEHAYSNSTWTQASTASFMTSLQHSVLGGLRRGVHSTPVPAAATTFAEHMRRGGYLTAAFTSNPNAGRVIGLERGVDVMRDTESGNPSTSSAMLHELFRLFRRDYPGHPWWVHFQTTDVHEPNESEPPFAGRFVPEEQREQLGRWDQQLFESAGDLFGTTSIADFYDRALERASIDRHAYYDTRRGLYDETMAFQDRELERFVERLKAEGEWENTLLVIGADHGHPAGTFARFGRGLLEPRPESWQGALFDAYSTRVPLVFVWPGHIPGGRRIAQAVSMLDVLPTVLDLVGLPAPEVAQGRSLAPLLSGKGELEPRPVILDEFRVDEASGELVGNLEILDGRWGASLEIGPGAQEGRHAVPAGGRWGAVHPFFSEVPRLLLYDLEQDPFASRAVNDEHPEEVERYRKILLEHWEAHRALAQRYAEAGDVSLSPEQLQDLQDLGYIR